MNVLIVSPSPGARCGIARYAAQQAQTLRQEGHEVHWASTDGGPQDVDHPLDLVNKRGDFLRLLALARSYERVIIQHQQTCSSGLGWTEPSSPPRTWP